MPTELFWMVEASGVWEVSEPLLLEAAVKFYRPKGIVAKVVNHFAAATDRKSVV